MYVVCVTVHVLPAHVADFVEATMANHRATRQEAGNRRFDVLQHEEDPTQFFLYEVYVDKDAFVRHQQTPHYLAWKQTVAPWMARPRSGVKHHSLLPADAQW